MLASITYGTFYFFFAFCIIILVWVYWFVPETKNRGIEEMDRVFGGNQGEHDLQRIMDIRAELEGSGDAALRKDDELEKSAEATIETRDVVSQ